MKSALTRWLPAIATFSLLLLALLAPVRRVGAGAGPRTDSVFNPSCDLLLEQNGSNATFSFSGSGPGITQPFQLAGNVAACSLGFDYQYYSGGVLKIRRWNPATLTPDPTTIALRTAGIDASAMQRSHVGVYFDPPLVLREVAGVAEGVGEDFALEFQNSYNSETVHYDSDGPAEMPVALQFASNPATPQSPLPGAHPVLDHRICGGNSTLQSLSVTQCVVECDSVIGGGALYEAAQRFRVAVPTELHWIEYAMFDGSYYYGQSGTVAVYDADGQAPPVSLPGSLVEAPFQAPWMYGTLPSWQTHYDFDRVISLTPDRDYWLVMRTRGYYQIEARRKNGSEGADYQDRIGPLLIRSTSISPWTPLPRLSLDFRVVGHPYVTVGVGPQSPARGALALAVSPSPSRGPVAVSWSGARGAVHLDVLDARGRRIATGEAAAGSSRWTWNAAGTDGRAVPAGVYFVRARDALHATTQRVVLVR